MAALLLLLSLLPAIAAPAEEPAAAASASALDQEIAVLRQELDSLSGEVGRVGGELEKLSLREALARRSWQKASAQRDDVARQVREEEKRSRDLTAAAEASRARARSALREAYKESTSSAYTSLLAVTDPTDLLRAFQSLGVVARRQGEAVESYERRRVESEAAARDLERRRIDLDGAVAEAAREQETLKDVRAARMALLERLQKDRSLHQQAVVELSRASESLAEAIRSLPPGAPPPKVTLSFEKLMGALPWPARGSIAVPFGSIRNPRFGTVTPHPGIEILVEAGAPVRSVGAGRVSFSRRFGGYGRTVVIDHGERYLCVYAHLAASTVAEGQDVDLGQEIGFAPEGDASGRASIYFEIRHQGKALDPENWLRGGRRAALEDGRK